MAKVQGSRQEFLTWEGTWGNEVTPVSASTAYAIGLNQCAAVQADSGGTHTDRSVLVANETAEGVKAYAATCSSITEHGS